MSKSAREINQMEVTILETNLQTIVEVLDLKQAKGEKNENE